MAIAAIAIVSACLGAGMDKRLGEMP